MNLKQTLALLTFVWAGISCGSEPSGRSSAHTVEVSSQEVSFQSGAATTVLQVTAAFDWGIASNETWCKVTPRGGIKGTTGVSVSVEANTTYTARSAKLLIKSGTTRIEIPVLQEALPVDTTVTVPVGYQLVWQEEFNDPLDANGKAVLPNPTRWYYETAGPGWVNNELQTYVAGFRGADTVAAVSNGTLKITAKKVGKEILSARLNTHEGWTYGYFEARLNLPKGRGCWPAFWMMPKDYTSWPNDGEIDIMEEVGYDPNTIHSTIHCKAYNHAIGTQKSGNKKVPGAEGSFHVYALEWTPEFIKAFVDNQLYFTFLNDGKNDPATWPFNKAFNLKLNLAWGGGWGGAQGVDESVLPAVYEIDYVRVFQKTK